MEAFYGNLFFDFGNSGDFGNIGNLRV